MSRLPDGLTRRDATSDDLAAIAGLRASVGWGVHEWALRAVIGQADAICVLVADPSETIIGVGSGIAYGELGFVGNMVVANDHRRRGIGSAILGDVTGFLENAGCVRIELNATSEGRPLYERHGFRSTGTSATAEIPRETALRGAPTVDVRRGGADDLGDLAAYDRPRFGGDRRRILQLLLNDPNTAVLIARGADGTTSGYGCVHGHGARIGPLLADAPEVAETLLGEAFREAPTAERLRLNLPPDNQSGRRWLRGLGVETAGWDGRMARGAGIERRPETLYGMAVGALG